MAEDLAQGVLCSIYSYNQENLDLKALYLRPAIFPLIVLQMEKSSHLEDLEINMFHV